MATITIDDAFCDRVRGWLAEMAPAWGTSAIPRPPDWLRPVITSYGIRADLAYGPFDPLGTVEPLHSYPYAVLLGGIEVTP